MNSQLVSHRNRYVRLLASAGALLCLWQAQAQPTIVSTVPSNGATSVPTNTTVAFTFSTAMNTTLTSAFFLYDGSSFVSTTPSWSAGNTVLTCTPVTSFPSNKIITWFVTGQSAGGQTLGGTPTGSFTTGPGGGGGGGNGTNAITSFAVGILHTYHQTSTNLPVLDVNVPYSFLASTGLSSNRTATNVLLTLPTAVVTNLTQDFQHPWGFTLLDYTNNLSAFNTRYPSGNYQFQVQAVTSNQFVTVNFPSTMAQPGAPHVSNFPATQALDPTQPFTLNWDAFPGGTSTDAVIVAIGNVFTSTNIGSPGALTGTSTSIVIPANTLQPNTNYSGDLSFYRYVNTTNGNSYVTTVYRATATLFNLVTGSGTTNGLIVLTNAVKAPGTFSFDVLCSTGQTVTVEYTTALPGGMWQHLLTTNSAGSRFHVVDPLVVPNPTLFFHARNGP